MENFETQLQDYVLEFDWGSYTVSFYSVYLEREKGPLVSVNIRFLEEAIKEYKIFSEGGDRYDKML